MDECPGAVLSSTTEITESARAVLVEQQNRRETVRKFTGENILGLEIPCFFLGNVAVIGCLFPRCGPQCGKVADPTKDCNERVRFALQVVLSLMAMGHFGKMR